MKEFMYDVNIGLIIIALFIAMALAMEIGFRIGIRRKDSASKASRVHINAIQASILGILALLLGFTFSLSLQRYDRRSDAVVDEANAIRATYLRAQLIAGPFQEEVRALLRDYLDLRIKEGDISLDQHDARNVMLAKAKQNQTALWGYCRRLAASDPTSEPVTLFIQSVSDVIDTFNKREAALDRHVPEVVLMLMYSAFLMAASIIGFTSGVAGHRPSASSYVMVGVMVILIFVILDLDRPRRGLINVSHQSFFELQQTMNTPANNE
jgi:hypothetical protein